MDVTGVKRAGGEKGRGGRKKIESPGDRKGDRAALTVLLAA